MGYSERISGAVIAPTHEQETATRLRARAEINEELRKAKESFKGNTKKPGAEAAAKLCLQQCRRWRGLPSPVHVSCLGLFKQITGASTRAREMSSLSLFWWRTLPPPRGLGPNARGAALLAG